MQPFWMAVQFLTRLPTPDIGLLPDRRAAEAFWYFPLVGLLLGMVLFAAALLFEWLGHWNLALTQIWVVAAMVVSLWAFLTGGLHLDGLADTADGWMSGASRERTLEIMRDSNSGAGAVIFVPLLLLLKFSALLHLLSNQAFWPLLLAPVIGRAAIIPLVISTPCARTDGMGLRLKQHLRLSVLALVLTATILLVLTLAGIQGLWVLLGCGMLGLALRQWMLRRLGGYTGDTLGASTELLETLVLLIAVFAP